MSFASACTAAQAADRHNYQFQFDEVPSVGPHGETVPLPGPIISPNAMTVESGEIYISDLIYHVVGVPIPRLDRFDAKTGSFLGQLAWPAGPPTYFAEGIAVGHAGGETQVYVDAIEEGSGKDARVVGVFDPAGTLKQIWHGTEAASKGFACCERSGVAVDDSSGLLGDWAAGDVYVADPQNGAIDVYEPETGGGEKKPIAELKQAAPGEPLGRPQQVAVSSVNGNVAVVDQRGVQIFRPAAIPGQYELIATLARPGGGALSSSARIDANDGEGDIYVLNGTEKQIYEFNAAGEYQGHLTPETAPAGLWGSETAEPAVVAGDPETHDVYVGTYDQNNPAPVFVFGPNVVLPDVATATATKVRPTSATLDGTVDLDKGGAATCQFEWGTSTALGEVAACSAKVEAEGKVPVSVGLSGLKPGSTYYYRLQAANGNGANEESQLQQFTTLGPRLVEASASEVASTSATLDATIDPDGDTTSYYFQYGKSTAYEAQIPLAPGDPLGNGTGDVAISHHIQELSPDTVYHYRVVTVSEVEVEPGVVERLEFTEPDQTFTTQVGGTGFALPDGRQWEMVSPPDKHGATIGEISEGIEETSLSGDEMTYVATLPTESEVAGDSNGAETQVLSTRGATGWSSQDISLPHDTPTGPSVGNGAEYRMFSEDLSQGLVEPFGEYTSLGDEASPPDSESTLYLRHDFACAATPSACYEPLLTGAPGYADVPPGTKFGSSYRFVSGTPDLAHVVLSSSVALTSAGGNLYEFSAGRPAGEELQSIAILPKGEGGAAITDAKLGASEAGDEDVRNAISADGSRVVWGTNKLYLRDLARDETVRLDAVQGGSGQGYQSPDFQFANSEGTRVFFTDSQQLTKDSHANTNKPDLYECEIVEGAGGLECALHDLTPGLGERSASVQGGLLGAGKEADVVYFVATGVLSTEANARHEKALEGADNLYVMRYGAGEWEAPQLIGVLSGEDSPDWLNELAYQPTRVSPNGRYLAFMSDRPLTGYDNHDASSGIPDEEVFLFDSASGRLVCASCDPTGALPHGVEDDPTGINRLVDGNEVWSANRWLAANIPGWTPYALSEANYQSRYLSNEGRLFFNSSDALVPQDINGTEDVYEYEPAGVGDCTTTSSTFGEGSGGCVGLISSGTSATESAFLDASENGDDVFFLTAERLVPQDVDSSLDVYDAHVCTTTEPCFAETVSAPACTTADSCRAAPTPQPTAFGSPASATFSGAGNVSPSPAVTTARAKPTRAQRLASALRECRKRYPSRRGKRTNCERQSRKRLGGGTPRKTKATSKRGGR